MKPHLRAREAGRKLLLTAGWIALAAWVGLLGYVRVTNRWGVFAVAPLLLPMLLLSTGITVLGIGVCLATLRHNRWDAPVALLAAMHGVIIWYAATHHR
jgi:CHASE2 domain-containing sensor protein